MAKFDRYRVAPIRLSPIVLGLISVFPRLVWFDQALPIVQGFGNLTFHAGIYGIKSIENTVLYVGKASAFRTRFQVGHQALNQMFIDGLSVASIRLITVPIGARFVDDLLTIEKGIIFVLRPRYRTHLRSQEDTESRFSISLTKQRSILALA